MLDLPHFEHLAVLGSALGILGGSWEFLEGALGSLGWPSEALGATGGLLARPVGSLWSPWGSLVGTWGLLGIRVKHWGVPKNPPGRPQGSLGRLGCGHGRFQKQQKTWFLLCFKHVAVLGIALGILEGS